MKIQFKGVYTLEDFFQAFLEEREKFKELGITHISAASLYYQPVDKFGDPVTPRYRNGEPVDGWTYKGPYRSAARDFGL
ncbi:hypothetical protein HQ496_08320 [bacterium]|nr:hypothetical protein [bacterium]